MWMLNVIYWNANFKKRRFRFFINSSRTFLSNLHFWWKIVNKEFSYFPEYISHNILSVGCRWRHLCLFHEAYFHYSYLQNRTSETAILLFVRQMKVIQKQTGLFTSHSTYFSKVKKNKTTLNSPSEKWSTTEYQSL